MNKGKSLKISTKCLKKEHDEDLFIKQLKNISKWTEQDYKFYEEFLEGLSEEPTEDEVTPEIDVKESQKRFFTKLKLQNYNRCNNKFSKSLLFPDANKVI